MNPAISPLNKKIYMSVLLLSHHIFECHPHKKPHKHLSIRVCMIDRHFKGKLLAYKELGNAMLSLVKDYSVFLYLSLSDKKLSLVHLALKKIDRKKLNFNLCSNIYLRLQEICKT